MLAARIGVQRRALGWIVASLGLLMPPKFLAAEKPQLRETLKEHTESVQGVAFSPDGKTLASGSKDTTVKLWEVATGKERATLKGHTGSVTAVAFGRDVETLVSASADGSVRRWSTTTGQERATYWGQTGFLLSLTVSPDGKTLA